MRSAANAKVAVMRPPSGECWSRRSTVLPRNPHAAALGRLGGLKVAGLAPTP